MHPQLLESHGACTPCELCVAARITSRVMLFFATEDQLKPHVSKKGCNVKLAPGSCGAFHSASGKAEIASDSQFRFSGRVLAWRLSQSLQIPTYLCTSDPMGK